MRTLALAVSRGAMDVFHPRAQKPCGPRVVSIDRQIGTGVDAQPDAWREWLAIDNRVSPADEACFRLDFADWLDGLPTRKRQMAELLSQGRETGVVATALGVSPGAVSQTRTWLEASWRAFQGGDGQERPAPRLAGRQSRGRPATASQAEPQ